MAKTKAQIVREIQNFSEDIVDTLESVASRLSEVENLLHGGESEDEVVCTDTDNCEDDSVVDDTVVEDDDVEDDTETEDDVVETETEDETENDESEDEDEEDFSIKTMMNKKFDPKSVTNFSTTRKTNSIPINAQRYAKVKQFLDGKF